MASVVNQQISLFLTFQSLVRWKAAQWPEMIMLMPQDVKASMKMPRSCTGLQGTRVHVVPPTKRVESHCLRLVIMEYEGSTLH